MSDQDLLRERVLALTAATPSLTRSAGKRREVALLITSIVFAFVIFQLIGGIQHSSPRPRQLTFIIGSGWALYSAALSWFVMSRGRSTLGRPPVLLLVATILTPVVLVGWMHLNQAYALPIHRAGWRCLLLNLSVSALPLASFLTTRRRLDPRAPWIIGGAIGAVCATWGGVVVDLWCPLSYTSHVLVGHVLPIVLLVAVGAVVGTRTLGLQGGASR